MAAKKLPPALITLPYKLERKLPAFENYDPRDTDRFPESLPRYFIRALSGKGANVFDPFAGLGTTLFVAEELGRRAYGMEANTRRAEWAAGQLENWTGLINGDSADMLAYPFPKMDLVVTSPPFMALTHKWNPLYGGDPAYSGYDRYLDRMAEIFASAARLMKTGAYVVVHVDNLPGKRFTPLVRDMGFAVSRSLQPAGETILQWQGGRADYPYTHCLLFKKVRS